MKSKSSLKSFLSSYFIIAHRDSRGPKSMLTPIPPNKSTLKLVVTYSSGRVQGGASFNIPYYLRPAPHGFNYYITFHKDQTTWLQKTKKEKRRTQNSNKMLHQDPQTKTISQQRGWCGLGPVDRMGRVEMVACTSNPFCFPRQQMSILKEVQSPRDSPYPFEKNERQGA